MQNKYIKILNDFVTCVTGKRGNVEINNSPRVGIEPGGPIDLKSSTLRNELQRYPTSTVLVVVLVNPNHYMYMYTYNKHPS